MRTMHRKTRLGYTLLELLLALGLTVIVVGAIGAAIQLYIVALTRQQDKIERKQIARSVLTMIGNDLRAGIQYKAADYSSLENLLQTQMMMVQAPPPADEDSAAQEEPADSGVIVEDEVSFRPTLIGNNRVIMMDISRLPRQDQYNPLIATAESMVQSPSDVKSLAYFVSLNSGGMESQVTFGQPAAPGGLYRREIDRAVAAYMGDYDLISNPDGYTQLIANEIAQITFRYFDGEDWQDEWDAAEAGGFPSAVEVTIVIDPERSAPGSQSYSYAGADPNSMETYRSVIHLPISDLPPSAE